MNDRPVYPDFDSLPETIREVFIHGDDQYPRLFVEAALECLNKAGHLGPADEPGRRFGAGCYVLALTALYMDFLHIAEESTRWYTWDVWAHALDLSYEELRRACVARGNDCPDEPYEDRWRYGDLAMNLSQELRRPLMAALWQGYGRRSQLFLALARIAQEAGVTCGAHEDEDDDEHDGSRRVDDLLNEQQVTEHWSAVVQLAHAERETEPLAAVMVWVAGGCPNHREQSDYSEIDSDDIGLSDAEYEAWLEQDDEPTPDTTVDPTPLASDSNTADAEPSHQDETQPIKAPSPTSAVRPGQPLVDNYSPTLEERFLINPNRQIIRPLLAERLGILDCASFTCGLSGGIAARLAVTRFHYRDGEPADGPALVLDLFPYADIFPLREDEADALRTLLHRRDLPALRQLDIEYVRFYCPACGIAYAGEHWRFDERYTLDLRRPRGDRYRLSDVQGTCPQGHCRTTIQDRW